MNHSVVIFGSANFDRTISVAKLPGRGETISAIRETTNVGGKGLNQAVASRRAGQATAFIGALGRDAPGDEIAEWLATHSIDRSGVRRVDAPTGSAMILLDSTGENIIVVTSGANSRLDTLFAPNATMIAKADTLVLQCETPLPGLIAAAKVATESGTRVILNAAPASRLPPDLLNNVDVLVVNQHEANVLCDNSDKPPADLAQELAQQVPQVVVTLGAEGALWSGVLGGGHRAAIPTQVIDTTGAGDTFVGYLAAGLSEGRSWEKAIEFATYAAAMSAERPGAAVAIPPADEVRKRMALPGSDRDV